MNDHPSDSGDDQNRLAAIPKDLLIRVIHVDDSICVIVKPANLRSVPGHANPPPQSSLETHNDNVDVTATTFPARNAQACWIKAVKSFDHVIKNSSNSSSDEDWEVIVMESLSRLANSKTVNSVPRKWKSFLRHVNRYQKQIVPSDVHHNTTPLEKLAQHMFQSIEERYRPLMQLPEPTRREESALGQLILMGYGKKTAGSGAPPTLTTTDAPQEQQLIYAVHRLDCETSGVMVFARNERAASFLSQAWRQGDRISKVYWAKVREWPLLQKDQQRQGRIDLPLVPSTNERLKWQVQTQGSGKPSTTLWRVLNINTGKTTVPTMANEQQESAQMQQQQTIGESPVDQGDSSSSSSCHDILLELTPLTGRTHQLRIHCAHVGSGIVGDSLYGANRVEWTDGGNSQLCLHAYQLCFPHPTTEEPLEFTSPPTWANF